MSAGMETVCNNCDEDEIGLQVFCRTCKEPTCVWCAKKTPDYYYCRGCSEKMKPRTNP